MDELVSVIVPIYNVEKYLERCLDSIARQTYQKFEVIMVNDGSTDQSGAIAKRFTQKDKRFKYFEQNNAGVSVARNAGVQQANGVFITFIDSDDFVEINCIESLLTSFDDDADVVIGNYVIFDASNHRYYKCAPGKFTLGVIETAEEKKELLADLLTPGSTVMPLWKNMYRKKLICDNGITFVSDVTYAEDQLFNLQTYILSKKIVIIDKVVVFHQIISNSLSQGYRNDFFGTLLKLYAYTLSILDKYGECQLANTYIECRANLIAESLYAASKCGFKKAYSNIRDILNNNFSKTTFVDSCCQATIGRFKIIYAISKCNNALIILFVMKLLKRFEFLYRNISKKEQYVPISENIK